MGGRGGGSRKVLVPPINFIFKMLQDGSRVTIWLYDQLGIRVEGRIRGFDEFMNLVIDDAVEIALEPKSESEGRKPLGRILLKGDNVSLIQRATGS